jgi:hypothetical protein
MSIGVVSSYFYYVSLVVFSIEKVEQKNEKFSIETNKKKNSITPSDILSPNRMALSFPGNSTCIGHASNPPYRY